jgi:hypothetical protein
MSDFFTGYHQRAWAGDLESYKRCANLAQHNNEKLRDMANRTRHRVRADWPTHAKVFDAIDVECNSPYNYVPPKEPSNEIAQAA